MASEFYQLSAKTPQGSQLPMSTYQEKVVLIVNTATKCGLTPQFEGLENLYKKYKEDGFEVLGFPCNQFAGQEPETNETITEVCQINHGVTFQLTEKCEVNGENTHPVFQFLKKQKGGFLGSKIKWNFTKFLINREGKVVKRYSPITKPEAIEKDVKSLL